MDNRTFPEQNLAGLQISRCYHVSTQLIVSLHLEILFNFYHFSEAQLFSFYFKRFAIAFVAAFPIGDLAILRAIKHLLTTGTFLLRLAAAHFTTCHNFTQSNN